MSRRTESFTDRDVERMLEAPEIETTPPADLLDRLRADIAAELAPSTEDGAGDEPTPASDPRQVAIIDESFRDDEGHATAIPEWRDTARRFWTLAATLVVVAGAAYLWPRVAHQEAAAPDAESRLEAIAIVGDDSGVVVSEPAVEGAAADVTADAGARAADFDESAERRRQDAVRGEADTRVTEIRESLRAMRDVGSSSGGQASAESAQVPPASRAPAAPRPPRRPSPPPSPAPPPPLPPAMEPAAKAKRVPAPRSSIPKPSVEARQSRTQQDDRRFNESIESSNRRIEGLQQQAEALEREMKQLESQEAHDMVVEESITVVGELAVLDERQVSAMTYTESPELASPNDAPYDTVYFESAGTNPFVDTEDDALSTFGLDVDTGSWGVVKRHLKDGHLPPPDAVRIEELLNAFEYDDPPPSDGSDFAVHVEAAPAPYAENERVVLMRVGIKGREIDVGDRAPATLIFVVDVSGSMNRENRLGLVVQSLRLLLDQMRPGDQVGLVTYGSTATVVLEPTADIDRVRQALGTLRPGGSTNVEHGLTLAYQLAFEARREGAIHRVILCSDGVANTGATSADQILDRVRGFASQGVELTTVGFGMGNYNDVLMERLADNGNGRYAYVDALPEAHRLFVEQLTGTLQTIAAEARAQVVFDPRHVERWRLLGYENRDIADERFRDDTVDAGEIGAGHAVTVLYELKLTAPRVARRAELANVQLRWASIAAKEMVETSTPVRGADLHRQLSQASEAFRLAADIAEFAEILKRSFWARGSDPKAVATALQRHAADRPGDAELAELAALAVRAADQIERLRKPGS